MLQGNYNLISPSDILKIWEALPNIIYTIGTKWNMDNVHKGRLFEDEIIKMLQKLGYDPWKTPGRRITIEGISDIEHEHDIIFVRRYTKNPIYFVECKWRENDLISKNHIMIFNQKALDTFFRGYIDGLKINRMYRIFISSQPLTLAAFKMCLTHGILVVMPFRPELIDRSKREGGPVILPPLEWAIITVNEKINRKEFTQDTIYLLRRLKNFRKKVFRDCSAFPNRNIHNGERLFKEYKTLIWETEPNIFRW